MKCPKCESQAKAIFEDIKSSLPFSYWDKEKKTKIIYMPDKWLKKLEEIEKKYLGDEK